ncbi:hypothetical protein D3C81_910190 [compost metagenome]
MARVGLLRAFRYPQQQDHFSFFFGYTGVKYTEHLPIREGWLDVLRRNQRIVHGAFDLYILQHRHMVVPPIRSSD